MTRRKLLGALGAMLALPRSATAATTTRYLDEDRKGIDPKVDLTIPDGATAAVLIVHGGAFIMGSRQMKGVRVCTAALADAGLATLAVDYRLLGRGGHFEEAVDDVVAAMDWWRGVSGDHGVPGTSVGVLGMSAGAALATVAATEGNADAVVGVYGPYDFRNLPGQPVLRLPTRWLLRSTDPSALHAASPLARATAPIPTLLFHGTEDHLVPASHAHALVEARQAAGLPVELQLHDDGHGYLQRKGPAAEATLAATTAFLNEHLS